MAATETVALPSATESFQLKTCLQTPTSVVAASGPAFTPNRRGRTRWFYGWLLALAGLGMTPVVPAQIYIRLHSFGFPELFGGANPFASLVQGTDGLLYGTTFAGGSANQGTVFKLKLDGTSPTVLHSFTGSGDGVHPESTLVQGPDGVLYGTTVDGGSSGRGTVFKLNWDGSGYRILHSFTGLNGDGSLPYAGLIRDADGVLYGTTLVGGAGDRGTVFKLKPDGTGYEILHLFAGSSDDGDFPFASLVQGADRILYGTTFLGGSANQGTVFKLNPDGTGHAVLHSFTGVSGDGANPAGGLAQGAASVLYGTTQGGGSVGRGTVFKLNSDGTGYEILHDFGGSGGDGDAPQAVLVGGTDGALYGTTTYGGSADSGTVFKLDPDGRGYTILHGFTGDGGDGALPVGGLVQGADGAFYGTTASGGDTDLGTVFCLVPFNRAPVVAHPIPDLTGAFGIPLSYTFPANTFTDPDPGQALSYTATGLPPGIAFDVIARSFSGRATAAGTFSVKVTATDNGSPPLSSNDTFKVTVAGARNDVEGVANDLVECQSGVNNSKDRKKLADAIERLEKALDPALWVDETHIVPKHGERVFQELKEAVHKLEELLKDKHSQVPDDKLQALITRIVNAVRLLAEVEIQAAANAGTSKIVEARQELAKGDEETARGKSESGIAHYRNAWKHAVHLRIKIKGRASAGGIHVEFLAEPRQTYAIEASTNLTDWVTLGQAKADADGVVGYDDKQARPLKMRFYRARLRP